MLSHTLTDYIKRFIEANQLPGLSVAVVKDGGIVLAEGFGVRSVVDGQPVTPNCLYHMASVSKPFSATALMQLAEQGKVDLDARLVEYLPWFTMDDPRVNSITLRQMLNHISGMPDVHDYEWGNPYTEDDALEVYARSLSSEKLLSDPGTQFAYSNIAFELLGTVIARVSGLTFEEYMRRNIFDPLGMKTSTFLRGEVPDELAMTPHNNLFGNEVLPYYPYNRAHAPSSTFHTSANEACRWMQVNLNRGELDGVRILQDASYDLLWKPYFPIDDGRQIGLSWFLQDLHGFRAVGHGGSDDGFRSMIMLVPEMNLGVTVMSNANGAPMLQLATALVEIGLGFEPEQPRPSVYFPVMKAYLEEGFDSALDCIHSLRGKETYQMTADRFANAADQLFDQSSTQTVDVIKLGLSVDPKSAALHAIMALEYGRSGDVEKASAWLDQAENLEPDNFVVKYVKQHLKDYAPDAQSASL